MGNIPFTWTTGVITAGRTFWSCFWRITKQDSNLWPCRSNCCWHISLQTTCWQDICRYFKQKGYFEQKLFHFTKDKPRQRKISQLRSKRMIQGKRNHSVSWLTLKYSRWIKNIYGQPHQFLVDIPGTTVFTLNFVIFAQLLPGSKHRTQVLGIYNNSLIFLLSFSL